MNKFSLASRKCHKYLKDGQFAKAKCCFKELAELLHEEKKYTDELKILMLVCYMELNTSCEFDTCLLERISSAASNSRLSKSDRFSLYLDTVREDCVPRAKATLLEGFEIFEYYVYKQYDDASKKIRTIDKKSI